MQITISDETLRDGEQQVGVNFSKTEKLVIADQLSKSGADQIAIMPIVSKYEEKTADSLLHSQYGKNIYASTLLDNSYVDHSLHLGFKNIILFTSLSDRLLHIKSISKKQNIIKTTEVCKYAKRKGLKIIFAGEDASRANIQYVIHTVQNIQKYLDGFIFCDTVGILTPRTTGKVITYLKSNIQCKVGVHFHNDRGLANKNTVIAVKNGAEIISGTAGGIGERAGNADWCEVLLQLRNDGFIYNNIRYATFPKLKRLVYTLGGSTPARPYSQRAFWHESGIHVHALMADPLSYNSFLPEKYGKRNRYFYGKYSGISNYKHLFGNKYTHTQLVIIRDRIKNYSYKYNKSYTAREIKNLIVKKRIV